MRNRLLVVVLVLASLMAACSPAATPVAAPAAAQPTEPPAAVATQPAPPTATAPAQPTALPSAPFPTGRFEGNGQSAQYNPDGTFEYYTGASKTDPVFIGTYSVNGNLITTENPNETDPKCQGPATYQWQYADNKLTFTPTGEDACRGRREANADTYTYNPTYLPELRISAMDYSYRAPLKVRSGWTRVVLTNKGTEPHHVQFLRLNDGVTVDQFEAALQQGEGPALAMTQQVGGVGAIHPGGTASAVIDLAPGEYVLLCLIPSPSDHTAHHTKGMIRGLTVQDADGHGVEPTAGLTVDLKDFVFDMPGTLAAGPLTVQVLNNGPEPHEFNILQLAEGKTAGDVMAFLTGEAGGPPPFTPVGGMNGLDAGVTGYAELDLTPGQYVAICNIPSPKAEGHPHFALGMIKEFTVESATSSNFPTGKFIKSGTTNYGLMFNPDGTFWVFDGDNIFVHGTYQVAGNVFTETSNDGGCKTNVDFTYTFDGTKLTLSYAGNPDDDMDCTGRHADFNNVTYTLAQG